MRTGSNWKHYLARVRLVFADFLRRIVLVAAEEEIVLQRAEMDKELARASRLAHNEAAPRA